MLADQAPIHVEGMAMTLDDIVKHFEVEAERATLYSDGEALAWRLAASYLSGVIDAARMIRRGDA